MKKIALILVFALLTMAFASCSSSKPNDDDTDINPEELLGEGAQKPEDKPTANIRYDCVYENYTYDLYVDENYIEITGYDFGTDNGTTREDGEELIETIDISIPAEIEGVSVKKIAKGAFEKSDLLASVTIPEGVTEIAAEAFWFSTSLESVNLPSTLTTIGERAFAYCPALTALAIPASVTEIPSGLCIECTALENLTFGNNVTAIGDSAFAYCTSLKTVDLGSALVTIGASAFKWCISLTKADLPATVTTVGEEAFAYCTSLVK